MLVQSSNKLIQSSGLSQFLGAGWHSVTSLKFRPIGLRVQLEGVTQLEDNGEFHVVPDAEELIDEFCRWRRGKQDDGAVLNILITRRDICRWSGKAQKSSSEACKTLGLAELNTMCTKFACAVIQDQVNLSLQ